MGKKKALSLKILSFLRFEIVNTKNILFWHSFMKLLQWVLGRFTTPRLFIIPEISVSVLMQYLSFCGIHKFAILFLNKETLAYKATP